MNDREFEKSKITCELDVWILFRNIVNILVLKYKDIMLIVLNHFYRTIRNLDAVSSSSCIFIPTGITFFKSTDF
uniref:Uncharacterized protein n=1 Tax=Octopus bimaculoides TaxID=37653 RepID=A0A0L8GYD1_OCTBM